MKKVLIMFLIMLVSFTFAAPSTNTVPFQAKLFQSAAGDLVPNGSYTMTLAIYSESAGTSTPLWTEVHTVVDVWDGNFGIFLGETTPFPSSFSTQTALYLKVTLAGQTVYGGLIPITAVLFSQFADLAATANYASTSNFSTKASALSNMNISQFANDSGYVLSANLGAVVINTANYAVKAGSLINNNVGQFTNDAGFITAGAVTKLTPNTANYASTAGVASTLSNMNVSQFTNDSAFVTTGIVLKTIINTANYAVKAGSLMNMNLSQFSNDLGFLTINSTISTATYAAKATTANVALAIDASNIFGAITVSGATVNVQQNLNVTNYVSASSLGVGTLSIGTALNVAGYAGQDATINVVVDTQFSTWGFLQKTFQQVVIKKGIIVSVGAPITK
jgi:hypothetical protein